ncbi:MAG: hypothetical protein ACLFQW_08260 [Spirochaetaceae bacterium]
MKDTALALHRKYQLVHVPNHHKVRRWAENVRRLMGKGYPPEQAGMEAARSVFTYEYGEKRVFGETPVKEILSSLDSGDTV